MKWEIGRLEISIVRRQRPKKRDDSQPTGHHDNINADSQTESNEYVDANYQTGNDGDTSTRVKSQVYEQLRSEYDNLYEKHSQSEAERRKLESQISKLKLLGDHETSKDTINRLSDQILVLRPYRTAFNRENAQSAFENLLFSIEGWVERFTDMFIDDQRFANEHVRFVNQHRHILIQFQELLASNQDLSSAVGYPDNDQNILAALIFRYVEQRIFGQTPCGISPLMAELLQEIQNTLPHCTSPPVDMTAISAWRGQAYHALFSQPNYPEARQRGINALSSELADILRFICAPGGWPAFVRSISSKIIEPSVRLDENFRRAHEEYYFDTASWTEPGGNMSELKGLLSVNAARFNAQMDVSELYPTPSMGQLREHFICSLHPALKAKEVRKLNQGENVRQSATLFKEKVLVAWDPETVQGRDPATMKQKTWLSRIATP